MNTERSIEKRRRAGVRNADAAGAFDLANDLEQHLFRMDFQVALLRLVATSNDLGPHVADAMSGLAESIEDHIEDAKKLNSEICKKTWAYKAAPDEIKKLEKSPAV